MFARWHRQIYGIHGYAQAVGFFMVFFLTPDWKCSRRDAKKYIFLFM